MSQAEIPELSVAIARLQIVPTDHFAAWVLKAPYPGGYVHHDRPWPRELTDLWHQWLDMFATGGLPMPPRSSNRPAAIPPLAVGTEGNQPISQSGRLMQHLGIYLYQWLFDGAVQNCLNQSQGIAIGQRNPLRLRLDIRDPDLIAFPWEIMQTQAGKPALSLGPQLLFSRTTSDVDRLPTLRSEPYLKILLVLGQHQQTNAAHLNLTQEATLLAQVMEKASQASTTTSPVPCRVDTLLQPSPEELNAHLERGGYNMFFYAGHGLPGPDGGALLLGSNTVLSGMDLAQVLTRCRVTLAVFNACWGAQPDRTPDGIAIPRSSLAEVLIHHGVPAVLGMRDAIADQEALTFIQYLAQALAERMPIDQAVAMARQQLLALYRFNQPAWTLPVLYLHPEFNGELVQPLTRTELPVNTSTWFRNPIPAACLQTVDGTRRVWSIRSGLMRVGRSEENDLVMPEQWISQKHAEIFYRDCSDTNPTTPPTFFLRDFSRYGTLIMGNDGWQKIHHQEIPLVSGMQIKFGSSHSQALEFQIDPSVT